jgi:hypothetical protein
MMNLLLDVIVVATTIHDTSSFTHALPPVSTLSWHLHVGFTTVNLSFTVFFFQQINMTIFDVKPMCLIQFQLSLSFVKTRKSYTLEKQVIYKKFTILKLHIPFCSREIN